MERAIRTKRLISPLQELRDAIILIDGDRIEMVGLEMIREIRRTGVIASFAHGESDYEPFMKAVEAGVTHVTYTYNVMTGMHHRRPGAVSASLTTDSLMCELTADGVHVHPVAMTCQSVAKDLIAFA